MRANSTSSKAIPPVAAGQSLPVDDFKKISSSPDSRVLVRQPYPLSSPAASPHNQDPDHTRSRVGPRPLEPLILAGQGHALDVSRADQGPASHSPAQRLRIGRKRRCRETAATTESCGTSTRRQCERRRPSATPDSTASQVSIGPGTTEPANACANAEAGKRAPYPSLTRRQQSQHWVSKSPATAAHRQPHRGTANRTGLSQPAAWTPPGKQVEDSENHPTAFRPATTDADAFPQVSALFPAASTEPAAAPVRAGEHRRTPSPPRTGSLPSSLDAPARSPPATARSSSRT